LLSPKPKSSEPASQSTFFSGSIFFKKNESISPDIDNSSHESLQEDVLLEVLQQNLIKKCDNNLQKDVILEKYQHNNSTKNITENVVLKALQTGLDKSSYVDSSDSSVFLRNTLDYKLRHGLAESNKCMRRKRHVRSKSHNSFFANEFNHDTESLISYAARTSERRVDQHQDNDLHEIRLKINLLQKKQAEFATDLSVVLGKMSEMLLQITSKLDTIESQCEKDSSFYGIDTQSY